jgi:hypothetical protein
MWKKYIPFSIILLFCMWKRIIETCTFICYTYFVASCTVGVELEQHQNYELEPKNWCGSATLVLWKCCHLLHLSFLAQKLDLE